MIQHAFTFHISHMSLSTKSVCLCCICKRFFEGWKCLLSACDVLSMFLKDAVKFMVLNASKSFTSFYFPTACESLLFCLPPFAPVYLKHFSFARVKCRVHSHPLNYLNFNLNGLLYNTRTAKSIYHRKHVGSERRGRNCSVVHDVCISLWIRDCV